MATPDKDCNPQISGMRALRFPRRKLVDDMNKNHNPHGSRIQASIVFSSVVCGLRMLCFPLRKLVDVNKDLHLLGLRGGNTSEQTWRCTQPPIASLAHPPMALNLTEATVHSSLITQNSPQTQVRTPTFVTRPPPTNREIRWLAGGSKC